MGDHVLQCGSEVVLGSASKSPKPSDMTALAIKMDIMSLEDEEDKENNPGGDGTAAAAAAAAGRIFGAIDFGDSLGNNFVTPNIATVGDETILIETKEEEKNLDHDEISEGGDQWMDASDFTGVQNPTEWDLLLTRGSGVPSQKDLTRDSLFVKFDPLVQKKEVALPRQVESISEELEIEDINELQKTILIQTKEEEKNLGNDEISKGGDQWMDASDFTGVQNPTEWDLLLTRGSGVPSQKDLTRDSLFVKFDPLVERRETMLPPRHDPISELDESGRTSDANELVESNISNNQEVPLSTELDATVILQKDEKLIDAKVILEKDEKLIDADPPSPQVFESAKAESHEENKLSDQEVMEIEDINELQSFEELLAQTLKENEDIKTEIALAKEDLSEMESAFAEVLLNYESGKVYQKNFDHNQQVLTTHISELETCLARREEHYKYTEKKYLEMTEIIKKEQEARLKILSNENFKLKASLKMSELKVQTAENEIDHIAAKNANLQKMCDDMIQEC